MFDVFYLDRPLGLFAHERQANDLEHAREQSRTRYLWVIDAHNDYSGFDWLWEPTSWQSDQVHVWPSQHQQNGGTWLIPRSGHKEINRDHEPIRRTGSVPRLHIQHRAHSEPAGDKITRFISDYLGTLRRALSKTTWQHCWITADVCDYTDFDFTWHPSEWQQHMLHVFASSEQRFGDTFYIHVPTFMEKSQDLELLEWFDTIHFVDDISVPRRPAPVIYYESDSVVPAVWQHEFADPVVQFARYQSVLDVPSINLWRQGTRAVMPLKPGSETVLVPRDTKNFLKIQIYDYPIIEKSPPIHPASPLDIVFISNSEHGAEHHWYTLCETVRGAKNRVDRVTNITGRVAAYQAAAMASTTDWFFAVFAKLQVNEDFDWRWQPDRLQQAKHYIFHAYNPVNHLTYGHQAMIAYNRRLVLENSGQGLDFTLDQPHEVVPVVSGTAYYDNDPWTCWRTAFRECVKLLHSLPDVENDYRLQQWLSVGEGVNGHWSTQGANDAVKYYDEVKGDFAALRKTYEWAWLASYAMLLHPELVTQSST